VTTLNDIRGGASAATSGTSDSAITILIDSREQQPWSFTGPTETTTLTTGDYTVLHIEHLVRIERKSLGDLVGCIGPERARFKRELERLRGFRFRALVIEASHDDIVQHRYRSNTHPNSILGSLAAWQIDYDLPIVLAGSHEEAGKYAERLLAKAAARTASENQGIGLDESWMKLRSAAATSAMC